jgi:hypothetical protein
MRVVYRGLAVVAAVAVAAVTLVVVLPSEPDEVAAGPIAAPSTPPSSSGPVPTPSGSPVEATPSMTAAASAAVASPPASVPVSAPVSAPGSASVSPASGGPEAVGSAAPRPTPTPGASLAPGYTAMEALYADVRVPRLPAKPKRLSLRSAGKKTVKDERSGLSVPRLASPWKRHGAAPFTTKQVLPAVRGSSRRGMFASCPLPIEAQPSHRDSALLAARWTLNHHPKSSRITWLASQPVKDGWMLAYRVTYGKRTSRAAVVVIDGGMSKPGLAFVTVPDTQKKRWSDITRVVSGVRAIE